jgi:hypothetical protein
MIDRQDLVAVSRSPKISPLPPSVVGRDVEFVVEDAVWWEWETCPACHGPVQRVGGRCLDPECQWPGDMSHLPSIRRLQQPVNRGRQRKTARRRARAARRANR